MLPLEPPTEYPPATLWAAGRSGGNPPPATHTAPHFRYASGAGRLDRL